MDQREQWKVFTGEGGSWAEMSFRELLYWNYQDQWIIYHGSGRLPETLHVFFFRLLSWKSLVRI